MAKKKTEKSEAATTAYPKEYVRVKRAEDGSLVTETIQVRSADEEVPALDGGYVPVDDVLYEAERPKYPAWRYGPNGESRIVHSDEEADALGKGWTDSPAPAHAPTEQPGPTDLLTPEQQRALVAQNEALKAQLAEKDAAEKEQ